MLTSLVLSLCLMMPPVTDADVSLEQWPTIATTQYELLLVNIGRESEDAKCRELSKVYGAHYMSFPLGYQAWVDGKNWHMRRAGISLYQSNGSRLELLERHDRAPQQLQEAVPLPPRR